MDPVEAQRLIAKLWAQQQEVVRERLEAIDAGVAALALQDDRRQPAVLAAIKAAHNLAGSLGSYGRAQGSVVARELMESFEDRTVPHPALAKLAADLRQWCV